MDSDSLLWHYTDSAGFHGIISSGIFRFGHAWFLNDRTERTFGKQRVADLIREEQSRLAETRLMELLHDRWQNRTDTDSDYFVASLSESSDSISQWQRYGGDGRGYCLGFDRAALMRWLQTPLRLRQMQYRTEGQLKRFREFLPSSIERSLQLFTDNPKYRKYTDAQLLELRVAYLVGVLEEVSLEFKNPRFEDEREWRFIRRIPDVVGDTPPPISFSPRGEIVKPFIGVSLKKLISKAQQASSLLKTRPVWTSP